MYITAYITVETWKVQICRVSWQVGHPARTYQKVSGYWWAKLLLVQRRSFFVLLRTSADCISDC